MLNLLKINFIKLEILKILRQRSALLGDNLETQVISSYAKLNALQAFHSKVQKYCFFTGRARGNYLGFLSRYKIRDYQACGFVIGMRKSH